jgi:S-DNA-T family DNA segregation ATPase FtsK/SpoIIIE
MPHLLVAGATGSGKSVCLNNVIISLLCCKSDVRLLLIDPKRVELAAFKGLKNVVHVYEQADILSRLTDALWQMEQRSVWLDKSNSRKIKTHNAKVKPRKRMPYFVIVIDEFAPVVLDENGKEAARVINKLALRGRSCGIHLVIATQRPSVDIISGSIKANFPARIAFPVFSKTDSRVVLDCNGAEELKQPGDMLMRYGRHLIQAKGAYVTETETDRYVAMIKKHQGKSRRLLDNLTRITG